MKNFIFAIILGGMLSYVSWEACAASSQNSAPESAIVVETSQEDTLLSYYISEGQTAHLFSMRILETRMQDGTKASSMLYNLLYVDIEQTATGKRRRVWQRKLLFSPQTTPQSFVFGPAETEGHLCLGMASDYNVQYLLLDLEPGIEEGKRLSPILSGSLHIPDLMICKILDVAGLSMPGTTIQYISYSSAEGWKLGIKITVLNFDSMLPIELQGTPKGEKVQWHIKKLF